MIHLGKTQPKICILSLWTCFLTAGEDHEWNGTCREKEEFVKRAFPFNRITQKKDTRKIYGGDIYFYLNPFLPNLSFWSSWKRQKIFGTTRKKPLVFWRFQGDPNGKLGRKGLTNLSSDFHDGGKRSNE